MFTIKDTVYTIKFNKQKVKTIELVTKKSLVAEVANNNGMLAMQTLETMFSLSLVEEATNESVKQSKAIELFDTLIEEDGLLSVNMAIVEKLQDDMGFMFR